MVVTNTSESGEEATFAATLVTVADVDGWMTAGQARLLWDAARRTPTDGGVIVEIGSFRGRSTIVLATAAAPGVRVYAVDPHGGGDRGPQEIDPDAERGEADHEAFNANLAASGVTDRVWHIRKHSVDALDDVPDRIDVLYVDGAHRLAPALDDIRSWGDKVAPGGTLLVHDSFSSIGVTLALFAATAFGPHWKYVGRSRSLAEFRRVEMTPRARGANAEAHIRELPWFARNIATKVAITVHASRLARRLGDGSGEWPY